MEAACGGSAGHSCERISILALLSIVAMLAAATQGALQQALSGGTLDVWTIVEWRIAPVLIWAIATPVLLGLARAVRRSAGGSMARELAAHVSLAIVWIALSNLLMRIPGALRGEPVAALLEDTLRGVVDYGPGATAAYVGLMALALPLRAPATGESAGSSGEASRAMPRRSQERTDHLAIRNGVRIHMVDRSEILWVEADGDHVRIHTAERTHRTRATLTAYQRELEPDGFLRIHRGSLVHPRAIREIQPYYRGDYVAILHDGSEIRIPRTRERTLRALLKPIGKRGDRDEADSSGPETR